MARQLKKPVGLAKVLGREAGNRLKAHFREKNKTPNKLGGTRQNFWRQIMQSVNQPNVSTDGALVVIRIADPRFAQKLYGGEIRAKRKKALAIPVSADAYGRAPAVLEQEEGVKLFVLSLSGQGRGRRGEGPLCSPCLRHPGRGPDGSSEPARVQRGAGGEGGGFCGGGRVSRFWVLVHQG